MGGDFAQHLVTPGFGPSKRLCLSRDRIKGGDMANRRLSMRKIKEVLRLKHEAKLSNRAIARSCNISNKTVKRYLERAQGSVAKIVG